jgi:hypothetical protein
VRLPEGLAFGAITKCATRPNSTTPPAIAAWIRRTVPAVGATRPDICFVIRIPPGFGFGCNRLAAGPIR